MIAPVCRWGCRLIADDQGSSKHSQTPVNPEMLGSQGHRDRGKCQREQAMSWTDDHSPNSLITPRNEAACQQIDICQVEQAQETLENALLTDPARPSLHLALLEIYRHGSAPAQRPAHALHQQVQQPLSAGGGALGSTLHPRPGRLRRRAPVAGVPPAPSHAAPDPGLAEDADMH